MTMLHPGSLPPAPESHATAETGAEMADRSASELLGQLQRTIRSEIPLAGAIGICAIAYDSEGLRLGAPLAPNINDKGTVFSGSLNALITLAGWGLIWLLLREQLLHGAIVIQDNAIKYLQPVRRDFVAHARMPASSETEQFLLTLRRRGRARLSVQAEIWEDDTLLVAFSGRYVVDLYRQR